MCGHILVLPYKGANLVRKSRMSNGSVEMRWIFRMERIQKQYVHT
jgi:hypothetical protein